MTPPIGEWRSRASASDPDRDRQGRFLTAAMAGTSGVGHFARRASRSPGAGRRRGGRLRRAGWMPRKLVVRTDRNTHFAFAACTEALADASLDLEQEDRTRIGMVLAADYGGLGYVLDNLVRLRASPRSSPRTWRSRGCRRLRSGSSRSSMAPRATRRPSSTTRRRDVRSEPRTGRSGAATRTWSSRAASRSRSSKAPSPRSRPGS